MKILDRYIIGKFLGTFFFTMTLIILIVVVIDLSEKVDDFIEKKAPFSAIVFDYYLNFIPYYVSLLSPLFIFIAVIFFTAQLANRSEIIAILGSGVNYTRFLFPYFIGATIIGLLNFALSAFIVPPCHKKAEAFEDIYVRTKKKVLSSQIYLRPSPGTYISLESYNSEDSSGYNFSSDYFIGTEKIYHLQAERIYWNKNKKKWSLENYMLRKYFQNGQSVQSGFKKDTLINVHPDELTKANKVIGTMDYFELNREIANTKLTGSGNLDALQVEQYKRIASSFAMLVLTLLGVAISARKVRGGVGIHLGVGLFASFIFLLLSQFSTTFGISGQMPPIIAVWIPNIVYLGIGIYVAIKAPK